MVVIMDSPAIDFLFSFLDFWNKQPHPRLLANGMKPNVSYKCLTPNSWSQWKREEEKNNSFASPRILSLYSFAKYSYLTPFFCVWIQNIHS